MEPFRPAYISGASEEDLCDTPHFAKKDEHLANRLVSALVFAWDDVPLTTRGRLLHDAAPWTMASGLQRGAPTVAVYRNLPKIARRARQSTLTFNSTGSLAMLLARV